MNKKIFLSGMRDGIPIGLGYFAVSFSLGIAARSVGFNAISGFILSILNIASAGEYAGIALIAVNAAYFEVAFMILITNARYLLMSCALSQKLPEKMPFFHRFIIGIGVTDELFGIGISYKGKVPPEYLYGAYLISIPLWAIGTSIGVVAGDVLPPIIVNALSVAIFGMFIAIIIPPAKENKAVAIAVLVSFALSYLFKCVIHIPYVSDGIITIALTVIIASVFALLFPVKDDPESSEKEASDAR